MKPCSKAFEFRLKFFHPKVVGLDDDFICAASCGSDFNVVLSESGTLFGWGSNSSGQLGRAPLEVDQSAEQAKVTKDPIYKTLKIWFISTGCSMFLA